MYILYMCSVFTNYKKKYDDIIYTNLLKNTSDNRVPCKSDG